jgi:neutral ceramidase
MSALPTIALTLLCAAALPAQDLMAGLARVEITPSGFGPMYGYRNRKCGEATAVHDPLHAKALVLEAGGKRLAIVTMDLGSIATEAVFRRAKAELNLPVVLLAPSHTHSAPAFLGASLGTPGPSAYLAEVEEKILTVLREATKAMAPARLSVARGEIRLGYNRLLMREDGRARALFDNLDRVPYGPVDPEVVLLEVSAPDGKPRALIVHYTAHPVTLGTTNCLYSGDYPGVMQARVEAAMPGVQTMFVQGGAAETNPLFQGRTGDKEKDFATMTRMGELLAEEVLRVAKRVPAAEARAASIDWKTQTLKFGHRWEPGKEIAVGMTTALINGEIAIATVPGEPFLSMQTRWKEAAGVPVALFYGYTQTTPDAWPGYIPDIRSAAVGGYGADNATTIEPGAAERIMDKHLIELYGLRGMWLAEPGRP